MVSVLVATGILGIVSLVLATMLKNAGAGSKSAELRMDLTALRKTIHDNFNCQRSLGNPANATLPLTCSNYATIPIKRKTGSSLVSSSGKIGTWTVTAGCANNEIIFKATKSGNDPLTEKPWTDSPALKDPNTGALDLFRGTSEFCSDYFGGNGNWVAVNCAGRFSYDMNAANGPNDWGTTCRIAGGNLPSDICRAAGFKAASGTCKGQTNMGVRFEGAFMANAGFPSGPVGPGTYITCMWGGGSWDSVNKGSQVKYSAPSHILCQ